MENGFSERARCFSQWLVFSMVDIQPLRNRDLNTWVVQYRFINYSLPLKDSEKANPVARVYDQPGHAMTADRHSVMFSFQDVQTLTL